MVCPNLGLKTQSKHLHVFKHKHTKRDMQCMFLMLTVGAICEWSLVVATYLHAA